MPTVDFTIGHKEYTLSCQEGEERLLKRAAAMLDAEARAIVEAFAADPRAGVLSVAGRMVDRPHLVQAQRTLARAGD